jgi:hypothetical protein
VALLTDSKLFGPGAMFKAKQAGRNSVSVARSMDVGSRSDAAFLQAAAALTHTVSRRCRGTALAVPSIQSNFSDWPELSKV